MAAVRCEQVTKIYANGHVGLRALDLQVDEGELLAVVGPSGCGKSTFLRVLAGLEAISNGALWIGERRANALSPRQRNIAMVFQDYALYPTMTVRENLAFPLKMRRFAPAERDRRIAWVAELLELGPVLERHPRELSGGQRQRVAMGRALVREPSVFLLDEPLSNLDARLRAQVRAEIGELQRRTGTTMIYVTHDQVEAMTLGHRIAVLRAGRLQQVADPSTLYAEPANAFVAGFIGSPPMNLFPAEVDAAGPDKWIVRTGGVVVGQASSDRLRRVLAPGATDGNVTHRVLAGIRPEHLREAGPSGAGFPVTVMNIENLGHETLIYCRPEQTGRSAGESGQPWIARLPGFTGGGIGSRLWLACPGAEEIQFFDQDESAGGTGIEQGVIEA